MSTKYLEVNLFCTLYDHTKKPPCSVKPTLQSDYGVDILRLLTSSNRGINLSEGVVDEYFRKMFDVQSLQRRDLHSPRQELGRTVDSNARVPVRKYVCRI